MDKSSAYEKFTGYVDQLRNTECSQKQKIVCFQQIADCILSSSLAGHINYAAHCGTATNVLLLFCEDLDSVVRMSAEENLNKIFRGLEKTRVSRILMDLYGEIKRNGNQRSLRICLNLFSYYAPQIKEKYTKWYAVRLLQCMSIISQRKETLLQETLSDFVKHFGRHVQQSLNDSETCKLLEIFVGNISSDCAVKRRCSAQNCISLIEHARNRTLMARHGLNKVIELLLNDGQETSCVLGALGLLRLLLPQLIRGYCADYTDDGESLAAVGQQQHQEQQQQVTTDCRQIIEIYDYCLHLLSTQHTTNHAIINAALEVINGILQSLDGGAGGAAAVVEMNSLAQSLRQLLCNQELQHNEYLRRRKSLKNQIFQLKNYQVAAASQQQHQDQDEENQLERVTTMMTTTTTTTTTMQMRKNLNSNAKLQQQKCQQQQQQHDQLVKADSRSSSISLGITMEEDATSLADEDKKIKSSRHIRNAARSISECVAIISDDEAEVKKHEQSEDDDDDMELLNAECDDFTTLSQLNEPQQTTPTAIATTTKDKLIDGCSSSELLSPQHQQQQQSSMQNLLADDKSQNLSDIDNESFNSIDFEAEITIAGGNGSSNNDQQQQHVEATANPTETNDSTTDATTIGTFFNNLLSHSNAASESVSKLFRQSSGSKSTPSKSAPAADKSDAVSTASLTLSLSSMASSSIIEPATPSTDHATSITSTPTPAKDQSTSSVTASYTASTALLMDAPAVEKPEAEPVLRRTPNANPFLVENSPLKQTVLGHVLISVKIGGILEQSLVYYTARLVGARFLLSGQAKGLQPDNVSRVSIKSLSLTVIAQCVRLAPRVLQLPLEITDQELRLLEQTMEVESGQSTELSSPQSSNDSQNTGEKRISDTATVQSDLQDNQLLLDIKDDHFGPSTCPVYCQQGPPNLSRSADTALLRRQLEARTTSLPQPNKTQTDNHLSKSEIISSPYSVTIAAEDAPPLALPPRPPKRTKSMRSRTGSSICPTAGLNSTPATTGSSQAISDVLLFYTHSDPMLRGGVQQIVGNFVQASRAGLYLELTRSLSLQHLLAILLKGLEDDIHTVAIQALNAFDKIFPHVVSKYLTSPPCHYQAHQQQQKKQQQQQQGEQQPSGQQKMPGQTFLKDQDNALSSQQQEQYEHEQQRTSNDDNLGCPGRMCARSLATDNDELLAALLNDFQLQSTSSLQETGKVEQHTQLGNEPSVAAATAAICPKLLLSKLRLCHHNKYWLVQNKYAEVISNLNYVLLRSYYANFDCGLANNDDEDKEQQQNDGDKDIACTYETQFLAELLHLLGDDDVRVREHAACCLCRFIMQTARHQWQQKQQQQQQQQKQQSPQKTMGGSAMAGNININDETEAQQTNFNLLWDFFDYRIFGSMSVTLRNLFRTSSTIGPPLADPDAVSSFATANETSSDSFGGGGLGGGGASTASAYFDGSYYGVGGISTADGHVFASTTFQRQIAQEEKVLAKVLYRMTNKLMTLNDKNLQFGIIYALRLLLKHFNFVDYQQAWTEFNFIEICMSYAYYNSATAADLSCQNDLIDVMAKLMAGSILATGETNDSQLDFLLRHCMKLLNIYYHLVTNQRLQQQQQPPHSSSSTTTSSKSHKSEFFTLPSSSGRTGELVALQALGYFGGDYVYMKLYNILRGANDSYKITINHEAGSLLICLLKSCLNALSFCLDAKKPSMPTELKLIEEILRYLTKLINYAPAECVACLRQLLKYLFAQNYASRVQSEANGQYHATFTVPYFVAKGLCSGSNCSTSSSSSSSILLPTINSKASPVTTTQGLIEASPLVYTSSNQQQHSLGMLFVQGLSPATPPSGDCVRLIKLFEPLVIYCLTLFMKSNALVQAPILQLLSQLLDLNVTYSILDSKNVIFEQILNNLELIENGMDRNACIIVPHMMKFLMQLTHKSDRQLITIPKIISITNNLLANGSVREVALIALKTLSYELFFMQSQNAEAITCGSDDNNSTSPLSAEPTADTREALLAQQRELDTQKEVVLGMLEKFIDTTASQQVLALLVLYERSGQHLVDVDMAKISYRSAHDADAIYGLLCRTLYGRQLRVHTPRDLRLVESCFRNNGNYVLADSKDFLQLLQLFIEQDVGNFGDLALAMVMLANVILKTEEIYLVNHIKLYLKNNPTAEQRLLRSSGGIASSLHLQQWQDEAPSTSSAAAAARAAASARITVTKSPAISEINYFAKVLSEKLLGCLDALLHGLDPHSYPDAEPCLVGNAYCHLAGRFVNALYNVCCRSRHKDALQSVFRLVLAESEFLCKYSNLLLLSAAGHESLEGVLLACLQLMLSMRLVEPLILLELAVQMPLKWTLKRALLHEVCQANGAFDWSPQQVERLLAGKYLNFLITDHLEFLGELSQGHPKCSSLLLVALHRHANRLNRHSIRIVVRLLSRLSETDNFENDDCIWQTVELLSRLHQLHDEKRSVQLPLERLARRLISQMAPAARNNIYLRLMGGEQKLQEMLLKDLESPADNGAATPRIIDESWLFAQLIKFATQHADAPHQQQQLMHLLLEIQSEPKLQRLLNSLGPEQEARLLRHALAGSLDAMLVAFRQKCIQHAPHINYMQLPPLARVSHSLLMDRVRAFSTSSGFDNHASLEDLHVAQAMTTLLASITNIEQTALIYIEARVIEKFMVEHFLRPDHLAELLTYLGWLARASRNHDHTKGNGNALGILLATIDALLQHPRIWREVNASTTGVRSELLEVLTMTGRCLLQDTIFYQRHSTSATNKDTTAPQAIFLAKLIETQIDTDALGSSSNEARLQFAGHELAQSQVQVPLSLVASIGISLLRTHQFYAYAVTPHELVQHQEEQQQQADGKLPTIPVDSLSDVDVLRQFVKRLSIFGYTTRQQFEEYFMTFLLLINKVYDEHMVDHQEQYQIKQVCLLAIMELLMSHKTFPIVGLQTTGQFHHTTRWKRITCDSISLKKLHKVQLLVDAYNIFYQANLERQLDRDNVIGTRNFAANQYDLHFCWAQMEAYAEGNSSTATTPEGEAPDVKPSSNIASDMAIRNYRHFTQLSGIDFRSSTQLVFDVLQQMIELNHVLVLPNLVKFCEICESRDQIKWIKERILKLQDQVAMDDTISHQHIIYLLCRTQALLIPSLGELQHLCSLIGNVYLKSSHCFIRTATLRGLLYLLECCSKTNTAMGKLSEELAMLRTLIVGYINRHGIIDESPLQFSEEHTKLVWTLNYSLIEWTSKFVPQCHLLSNAIIAANNFLKTTHNEELYLCVLHGLERMVVNSGSRPTAALGNDGSLAKSGATGAASGVVVTPQLRHKIEKLALESLKMENEKFSIPALKLLLSCIYVGSSTQLETTELSNGIVQDDPEIIAQQNDKVDILLHCIKSSSRDAAWIYGQVLCQIIRDLVPPNEILTKVIKEFLAINQPHGDVIAMIVYQVFRSAIDSSYLEMLQDWLICTLPTFLAQPEQQGVWGLSVIFLSASINLHLIKLFPLVVGFGPAAAAAAGNSTATATATATAMPAALPPRKLGQHEIALFVTAAQDFHAKLSGEQRQRFRDAFGNFKQSQVYARMLHSL
ncbi:uncharacterized protein LOC6647961 [Drosophila willistoni]|uniref:uncharacterized protein LOC6647961 n=1 Tax=Drosophila willistoni TaxID=7260 RepID=UPI00017D8AAF|nr:uncharacterized protein LOC6647961 [Drosophila willistoni]